MTAIRSDPASRILSRRGRPTSLACGAPARPLAAEATAMAAAVLAPVIAVARRTRR